MRDPKSYDLLSVIVGLIGIHEGLMPFAAKLFDWEPTLALPLHLAAPLWWIVSAGVAIVAFVLLAVIDSAKKHRFGSS